MTSDSVPNVTRAAERTDTISDLLPVIGQPQRRQILECLQKTSPQSIEDVIDQLDPRHTAEADRAIRLSLSHTHLPLLADHGFIDWDRATGDICRGPCFDAIEPVLERIERVDDDLAAKRLPDS